MKPSQFFSNRRLLQPNPLFHKNRVILSPLQGPVKACPISSENATFRKARSRKIKCKHSYPIWKQEIKRICGVSSASAVSMTVDHTRILFRPLLRQLHRHKMAASQYLASLIVDLRQRMCAPPKKNCEMKRTSMSFLSKIFPAIRNFRGPKLVSGS